MWAFIAIGSFFAISSIYSPAEGLSRVIAFVLIACPCAFVFALPLSLGLSLKSGITSGFLVKDTSVFEKLPDVRNVFFDKTGTLTKGVFKILNWDTDAMTLEDKAAVLAIERESGHPVARAVVSYLGDKGLPAYQVKDFRHIPSKGVEARVNGSAYTLTSAEGVDQHNDINAIISTKIVIRKDGEPVSEILLGDSLKEDAKYVVNELKARGMKVFILSGDRESSVRLTGDKLGIPEDRIFWEMTPEQKSEIISSLDNMGTEASAVYDAGADKIRNMGTGGSAKHDPGANKIMMIGDGLNDAGALTASDVGVAIQGSVEESMRVSDAYILNNDLFTVLELIEHGKSAKDTVRRNTAFSIAYNAAAGTFALLGYISPLAAAVLMPLSSLLLIGSTLYGQKNLKLKELKARI